MRPDPEGNNSGFALVAVLVFMLAVSAIVVPFALSARTRLMIANNEIEQDRLSLLADGLTNVVSGELFDGPNLKGMSTNAEPERCRSGHLAFEVRVQDHAGLIDLNAGGEPLLAKGFAALGIDKQTAAMLAKAVVTFRTPKNAFAASAEQDAGLGTQDNKYAPFESVSELQEFPALASVPLHDLHAIFTVNTKRGTVALASTPKRLRNVLGGDDTQVVVGGTGESPAFTVEITTRRDMSGIVGQAGFVIEKSPSSPSGFRRVSSVPIVEAIDDPGPKTTTSCDRLFGSATARLLEQWSS